jgi:hypothetical protein
LKNDIVKLGRLNEVIDFAVLEDANQHELYFRDRTIKDFFAAMWCAKWGDEKDRKFLRDTRHIRGEYGGHHRGAEQYEFWRMLTEMPVSDLRKRESPWLGMIRDLYVPLATDARYRRSTEMMYRAWWGLMETAGHISRPATEQDLIVATTERQRDVFLRVQEGTLAFQPADRMPDGSARAADWIIDQFLAMPLWHRYGCTRACRMSSNGNVHVGAAGAAWVTTITAALGMSWASMLGI